jgi:succinate dehydrogenase/fumarate reductase flavoprotein subunit
MGVHIMNWPYPIEYETLNEVDTDILIIGGGLAGPMAAITAANKGLKVILVDKGGSKYSGKAGSGIDHYHDCPNPASPITADELTTARIRSSKGYINGIQKYITAREAYDVLLELESYGAKVRDTHNSFEGAAFRDEETKLLFSNDYVNRYILLVWGKTFKPALYKELKRTSAKLYERVMTTSLLTEKGKQGSRVVGATGFNVRTGQFHVFKAKAVIPCSGNMGDRGWVFSSELQGIGGRNGPGLVSGDGQSMAWRAGAKLTLMEQTAPVRRHRWTTEGSYTTSWFPSSVVDAQGKEIPWIDGEGKPISNVSDRCKLPLGQLTRGGSGAPITDAKTEVRPSVPTLIPDLEERIKNGEYKLPLYADFPSMPEHERRAVYGFKIANEGTTWLAYHNMTRAGFDPDKHQLQIYEEPPVGGGYGWRRQLGGGVVVDWDLKSNLEGLYIAGDQMFGGATGPGALTTGRYAARKAAEYATKASQSIISQNQVEAEKARVYAPIKRQKGIEWKELASGLAKVMQHYCGDVKSHERLQIGLRWLDELTRGETQTAYARNPHELMRTLEVFSLINCSQAIIHQSLARKASSKQLQFKRSDYPQDDPEQWHKFITIRQQDGDVKVEDLPIDYWGNLAKNYEQHCAL